MLKANRAFTALPLIAAACMASACAADVAYDESEADESSTLDPIGSSSEALVRIGGDRFWYEGKVFYRFDSSMDSPAKTAVLAALDKMSKRLPIVFLPWTDPGGVYNYINFRRDTGSTGGSSEEVGMDGGSQDVTFFSTPSETTVTHEVLHAIGLHHEQQRVDRNTYVTVRGACIDGDHWYPDYAIIGNDDSITSGVYDFESIMHYTTGTWCASNAPSSCTIPNPFGGTLCATVTRKNGAPIFGGGIMSREDVNSIYYMYSKPFDAALVTDTVGASVAVGDFDGDGYSDVAVGVPSRTPGSVSYTGEVRVYKGTSRGLYAWQTITQADVGWSSTSFDHFGWSLAAANIDGDSMNTAELVIGAPYHDTDGVVDSGAVAVVRSDGFGKLKAWRTYTQKTQGADVVRANARFGESVALGRIARPLDSAGNPEPDWGLTVAIGAPGTDSNRGAVFLYGQQGDTSRRWTHKIAGSAVGDKFGSALAMGSLETSTRVDLVVGSPAANTDRGKVDIFFANPPGVFSSASAPMVSLSQSLAAPTTDTRAFGASLAIGNLRGDPTTGDDGINIVIGAPKTRSSAGEVYIYQQQAFASDPHAFYRSQTIQQNETPEAGDEFGFALAVANVDPSTPHDELMIGAPGENSDEGSISVFRRSGVGLQSFQFLRQSNIPDETNKVNSNFGYALAAGSINGLGDSLVTSDDFKNNPAGHIPDVVVGSPGSQGRGISLFFGKNTVGLEGKDKY
ncbi:MULTISPECIES: M12 family metallopeptidase [Sorangium]|uniref:Peptidase M12A domain-containing protein n=1 Tax=Sorangium cellulosum TaxID=56 RepID=A0A4P2R252_SORCE|nr:MULTISPECIES: M12 family metallopeptidase [Sorangium]AUX37049.1 hypothetical protein SOCE836_092680 [Sorangium cellulosum]WCQ96342.1 hypothetical protein NQZ70_09128 [Sorangium sp. Soce836]